MARGFLSGVLMGGVFSVGVAGVASVMSPLPTPPVVGDAAPGVTTAPTGGADAKSKGPESGEAAPATDTAQTPGTAPDPDTLTALDGDTTQTAAQPQTGDAESLDAPADGANNSAVSVQSDDPVLPNPQSLAPMEPQAADNLSISTEPAQPPQPEPEPVQGAFDDPVAPQVDDTGEDHALGALPAQNQASDAAPSEAESAALTQPEADESVSEAVSEEAAPAPEAEAVEDTEIAAVAPSTRPAIGTPAISLTEREGSVTVNRLSSAPEAPQDDSDAALADASRDDALPIVRFAQPFENADNKPLLSIILIDDGTSPTSGAAGISALRSFPYPLSFAIDTSLPDAPDRMALYRAEGFEVLAMIDLPEGAAAADVETNVVARLQQMNEIVAVLEGTKAGLQGSREVSDQTTAILSATGHGLVTQDKGLNTMPKLARKEGVPARPIFRDFDGKGQSATVIRRFLDQAAFKAGQDGAVIMMGRSRPDTITALLLWGLQDRAAQVALAPISAVLQRE